MEKEMLSEKDFSDAFDRHQNQLLRYIASVLPKNIQRQVDAEDILQQTCGDAWKNREQFRSGNLLAWLKKVARRNVIDATRMTNTQKRRGDIYARRIATGHGASSSCLDVAGPQRTPSSEVAAQETNEQLQVCLDRLPARYRDILRMRYIEGMPVKAVAAALGTTEANTYMISSRALAELRKVAGEKMAATVESLGKR